MTPFKPFAMHSKRPRLALFTFLFACYAVQAIGTFTSITSVSTWYVFLAKPTFGPPNWVFAPIWTLLYSLMAVAAWLVWRTPQHGALSANRSDGLVLFGIQLALNCLWIFVFFHFHQLLGSLVLVFLLWVAILVTTLRFWKVHRLAAALMLPYLAWVSFATTFYYRLYRLN